MCCTGPAWKREIVPDHKFDFVDTRDYHTKNFGVRVQYLFVYVIVLKSFLVYISDIYTAVTMLSATGWSSSIHEKCTDSSCITVPFETGKWIFVGCIILSFLLLLYESRKAKMIIASRDISYAFTNVMANNYYSLRSYDHFCFFSQIENSTKKKDDFAFFIFFTFKEWKRLLLADGPRQTVNGLTLYSFWIANGRGNPFERIGSYYEGNYVTAMLLVTMVFTVLIFIGSLLLLIIAGVLYVPLLCYIRGNLKEYCCHKVDKRITELIKKKTQQRVQRQAALAKKEAAGDFSHLKGKKGAIPVSLPKQPTLPSVSVDDPTSTVDPPQRANDVLYWAASGDSKSDYAASTYNTGNPADYAPHEYPPMPGYYGQGGGGWYEPKPAESLYSHDDQPGYRPGMDNGYTNSTAHLPYQAQPYAGQAYGQEQYYEQQPQQQYQHQQHLGQGPVDDGYDQYAPHANAPSYLNGNGYPQQQSGRQLTDREYSGGGGGHAM